MANAATTTKKKKIEREYSGSSHLRKFLSTKERMLVVRKVVKVLSLFDYDAIAFSGMSGALLAAPVAMRVHKPAILVRKTRDDTHSISKVEGEYKHVDKYIIVDDFISTGKTVRRIVNEIKRVNSHAQCLGVIEANYLYDDVIINVEREKTFTLSKIPKTQNG